MKQGKTLVELAQELTRQQEAKRDFIADTRGLQVIPGECKGQMLMVMGDDKFPINEMCLQQIGSKLDIPAKYLNRLAEKHPDMLAYNVNALFAREPEKRMVRTLDGRARAFLSDRYRTMDHFDLAEAVIPVLNAQGAHVTSCDVTERKFYIKATLPTLVAEIPPPPDVKMGSGHTWFIEKVEGGITIMNSEIGDSRLSVSPAIFTRRCTNYAVYQDQSFSKYHLGRGKAQDREAEMWEIFSDKTKLIEDAALWAKVRDITLAACDGTLFNKIVKRLTESRGQMIDKGADPIKVVEIVSNKLGLNQEEGRGVLAHLIQGGELSLFGVHNAITRFSQDIESYDRATELEVAGGKVIELAPSEWREINKLAA